MAWAVEECSRAYTKLSARLTKVEARLDMVEASDDVRRTPAATDHQDQPPRHAPFDQAAGVLERLQARVDEVHHEACSRVDAVEERSRQVAFLPMKVSNLQRELDRLASEVRAMQANHQAPVTPQPSPEVRALRIQVAGMDQRLDGLEQLINEPALAAHVEEAVLRHGSRLTSEIGATVDVQGVYRELDRIAEFVTTRAAATAEALERLGPLEVAVLELRRDVERASGDRGSSQGLRKAVQELDARMEHVEASSEKIERLYSALQALLTLDRDELLGADVGPTQAPGAGDGDKADVDPREG